MNLGRRAGRLLAGWLSAFLAPADDPRRTFAGASSRQQELLTQVRGERTRLEAFAGRLAARTAALQQKLGRLEDQAHEALRAGDEHQARLALQVRRVAELHLQELDEQAQHVAQAEQRLDQIERRVEMQFEVLRAREEAVAARHRAAEGQARLGETLAGARQAMAELSLALEHTQRQADRMQARAAALAELAADDVVAGAGLTASDPLARQLASIEMADEVDASLAALKRQIEAEPPGEPASIA